MTDATALPNLDSVPDAILAEWLAAADREAALRSMPAPGALSDEALAAVRGRAGAILAERRKDAPAAPSEATRAPSILRYRARSHALVDFAVEADDGSIYEFEAAYFGAHLGDLSFAKRWAAEQIAAEEATDGADW